MVTRQRPCSTRLLVVALVSVSLAVITLDYRQGDIGPLAGIGGAAKASWRRCSRRSRPSPSPSAISSRASRISSLADENERLRRRTSLRSQIRTDAYEQEQYEDLLGMLELQRSLDPTSVPAVVIANGVSNFEYTITIDKGSDDGIEVDQPVATGFPAPDARRARGAGDADVVRSCC